MAQKLGSRAGERENGMKMGPPVPGEAFSVTCPNGLSICRCQGPPSAFAFWPPHQASYPPVRPLDNLPLDYLGTRCRMCPTVGKSTPAPEIMSLLVAELSLSKPLENGHGVKQKQTGPDWWPRPVIPNPNTGEVEVGRSLATEGVRPA